MAGYWRNAYWREVHYRDGYWRGSAATHGGGSFGAIKRRRAAESAMLRKLLREDEDLLSLVSAFLTTIGGTRQ